MNKKRYFLIFIVYVILVLSLARYISLSTQKPTFVQANLESIALLPTLPIEKAVELQNMSSQNYILLDRDTNQILIAKNEHQPIYPASTTKLASALTALNIYELSKTVIINSKYSQGKTLGLVVGQSYNVKSLLKALLIYSANDSAVALANSHPNGYTAFVDSMNTLIRNYGIKNTFFTNVDGTDDPRHISTAYDLSQLGRIASNIQVINDIVKMQNDTISTQDGSINHQLVSTNQLLAKQSEIVGLKTGWTPTAGEAFVGLINYNNHVFISVVADSRDRFGDTEKMLNWLKSKKFNPE